MLESKLLKRNIPYRVILPLDYAKSQKKHPVLYLLHGLFGSCDNWLELTQIAAYLKDFSFITVLVEGENGWYSDSVNIENDRFESYILKDLIPEIEINYQTTNQRENRAIAGLSMGGYGALKFGLKYPELFIFAGSTSGAFDAPNRLTMQDGFGADELNLTIWEVFGEAGTQTRVDNDIFKIVENYPKEKVNSLPYFYLDCGVEDGLLPVNLDFAKLFQDKHLRYEFHEIDGGHNWNYWNKQLEKILKIVAEIFNKN